MTAPFDLPRPPPANRRRPCGDGYLRDGGDVRRLGALLALTRFELDARALGEALEAVTGDVAVVDEEILRSLVRGDEAVPLAVVEPLDGSGCHKKTPPLPTHEQVRKAQNANRTRSRSARTVARLR